MNGIIDSISNLLMPLCSVWIVNKFVNNSFEKKESKKIFTRIIWGLFILIQIVMETEKGNVSIQKGIISFFVILGIIIIGYKGTFQRKLLFTSLFISIWMEIQNIEWMYILKRERKFCHKNLIWNIQISILIKNALLSIMNLNAKYTIFAVSENLKAVLKKQSQRYSQLQS